MRTVTRFSVPLNASSNVTFNVTFMSCPLRARGCRPPPKPPKSPKSQFEPNAPSPRRMLSRMSDQLLNPPAPPNMSSTCTEPPAPPHPWGIWFSFAVPYWSYNWRFLSSLKTS